MKLSEIYALADEFAPKRLSDEYCARYNAYDNSGILVDTGADICGVLFSLDLSLAAIQEAKNTGANLIITHHPAIYGKIGCICEDDGLGKKLIECIQNGISVIAMHLNLDGAVGGTDESLMQAVQIAAGGNIEKEEMLLHPLSEGGYGRAYAMKPCSLASLKSGLEKELSTNRILVYGDESRMISRAASFCGAGADDTAIGFAAENAEVVISADFKHHVIARALEEGLAVIALTHYASENYGFKKYYEKIGRQVDIPCYFHEEKDLR